MSDPRTKDVIDFVEGLAAQSGNFQAIGEEFYRDFIELKRPQIEKLTLAIMLDQDKEVARIAAGRTDAVAVEKVASFVSCVLSSISIGLARFDAFGRLGFAARVGQEPQEVGMASALEARYAEIGPIITNTVRRSLPWFLSFETSQGQLPM